MRVHVQLPSDGARPTPAGARRRPTNRQRELVRPGSVYRRGMCLSLAWIMANERGLQERREG